VDDRARLAMTLATRWARAPGWAPALAVAGLLLAVDLVHLRWVIVHAANWGFWDWDFQETLLETTRRSIVQYGQLPLWNPYIGGGSTLAGDSLNHTWGPSFLPILLLGTLPGIKVCLLLYLLIAQGGTYALARNHGLRSPGSFLAAILYSLGGVYAQHLAHGHFEWIAFAWFPLATLAVEGAALRLVPRTLALGGLVVAFCVFDGGPYQFAFLGVFLGVYAILLAVSLGSPRPVLGLGTILAIGAGLAAVKLVPMIETAGRFPRSISEDRFYGAPFVPTALQVLHQAFVSQDQLHRPDAWMPYVLNVGSYIGWLPLLLAIAGTVTSLRRHWPFLVGGLLSLWTALGTAIDGTPWTILRGLPGFAMLQVPSRFMTFPLLVVAVLAGAGLDAIERLAARFVRTRWPAVSLAIVALIAADLVRLNGEVFKFAFSIPPLAVGLPGEFRNYAHSPYLAEYRRAELYPTFANWPSATYPAVLENRGVLDAYRPTIPFPTHAVPEADPAFRGTVWSPDPAAEVVGFDWTPNRLRIETNGQARLLVVNQNYDPGWMVAAGWPTRTVDGLLAVSLPPGRSEVTLVYMPHAFWRGALVSLTTLALVVLLGAV
jgi:hypothetical protein